MSVSKKKILYCVETIGFGGVEQTRLTLANHLIDKYDISFVCTNEEGDVSQKLKNLGCDVHCVGLLRSPFDVKTYIKALKIAFKIKPDIIHGGVYEGNLIATFISIFTGNKRLILEETSDPDTRKSRADLLLRLLSFRCKKFIGVSQASYDYLIKKAKVDSNKSIKINNGVIETVKTNETELDMLKKTLGIRSEFVVGIVCRLFDEHKKISNLIKAIAMLNDTILPDLKLLIVGDGPDRDSLELLAKSLNISSHVIFVGYQSETRPFYDLMDLFVLPSAKEAFGLVLVEAMFARLPIIATNVGGIPYVVRNNKDGILVPVEDPASLSIEIKKIFDNPILKAELSTSGYQRAINCFSSQRYVKDIENLYFDLVCN